MGWYEGSLTPAAGEIITILDTYLVVNHSTWTVYDSGYAANEKVYRCYDPSKTPTYDFYLRVQDNQAAYATLEMYDHWDAVAHDRGVETNVFVKYGTSATDYTRIKKIAGAYHLRTHDNHFVIATGGATPGLVHFCGYLVPHTANSKIAPACGMIMSTPSGSNYNPVGNGYSVTTFVAARVLLLPWGGTNYLFYNENAAFVNCIDYKGVIWLDETLMFANTWFLCLGKMPGINIMRGTPLPSTVVLVSGNTISAGAGGTYGGGWVYYKATTNGDQCFVQKYY
jgi:hypothetical protein